MKPPPEVTFVACRTPARDRLEGDVRGPAPQRVRGDVAWTKALDEKLITPKPGIAADTKDEDATDMDVELATSGKRNTG